MVPLPIARIQLVARMSDSARRVKVAKLIEETKETILRIQARVAVEKSHETSLHKPL